MIHVLLKKTLLSLFLVPIILTICYISIAHNISQTLTMSEVALSSFQHDSMDYEQTTSIIVGTVYILIAAWIFCKIPD